MAIIELNRASKAARNKGLSGLGLLQDPSFKAVYDLYFPTFQYYMNQYGYYDLFLISKDDGDVFFTVAQESDFGTLLSKERHHLASLWKKSVTDGNVAISDMEQYAPSNDAPAQFVACPVVDGGKTIGVVALQIPNAAINNIMLERAGMGETGECYLVGPDLKMRSDSYLDPTGHSIEASLNGTVENNGVDTEAARSALAGNSGAKVIIDYNGNPVLSCYAPVEIGDFTWAVLAEIDVGEAFCPKDEDGKYFFAKYQEMYGYYDLFLINPDGYCFYTVAKEADYQTNFVNGTYSSSNLGKLTREVLSTKTFGFAGFEPYAPSNDEPAAFVAQPCIENGIVEMIVALQLPLDAVNSIMQERSGMGETGETYLVGPDKLMRSDSYLDPTGHSVIASFAGNVEKNGVDTEASRDALSGKTDSKVVMDYNGNPVLSAFTSLEVFGTDWALLAEIDEAEINMPISALRTSVIWIGVVIGVIVALFALWMAISIASPIKKITDVAKVIALGDLSRDIDIKQKDEIGQLADAFTEMKGGLVEKANAATEIAKGNVNIDINVASEQDSLGNAMVTMKESIEALVGEGVTLAKAAKEGQLDTRGDVSKFQGGYREIIQGMNDTTENILKPVNEAVGCLAEMAKGDLAVSVTGNYKGDHAVMKEALNSTLAALNDILGQVAVASEQIASGSQQVSDSSQSLSQGATESASSLEEITASMTEMTSQTKQNADNATQANQLAASARDNAESGNQQMQQMLSAMGEINESSSQISKIIKVIDEIAFQTNLLALNAAVEAARAGVVHGKGFAVVAEEVRNLAQRSAKAAKETTELIEGSVKKVENGTNIANATAKALEEIVGGITKVTDLVGDIASASNEQAQGIGQVNEGLNQIDQVTQSNTANAEESASASEELSSQAVQLKQMLARFKLTNASSGNSEKAHTVVHKTVTHTEPAKPVETKEKEPAVAIALDDKEFGKF